MRLRLPNLLRGKIAIGALFVPSLLMYIYKIRLTIHNHNNSHSPHDVLESLKYLEPPAYSTSSTNLTVNLVLATLRSDDISWTEALHLHIPNLQIIRYISDSPSSEYHPPVPNKGREALIYHTYFSTFYTHLPDISILIHAHESPWHADLALFTSMFFTLSHLSLPHVLERGYANLRASWHNACPDWINTTKTYEESWKQEEPFMAQAFAENFAPWGVGYVPEILAGPCCSQFAVSREAVLARPREQYEHHARWLVESEWSDYIVGRTWEHMFQFLFKGEGADCPVEWKVLCRMYGVCFGGAGQFAEWEKLGREREDLWDGMGFWSNLGFWAELKDPGKVQRARGRVQEIERLMAKMMGEALKRGRDEKVRAEGVGDVFTW